ncbi:glutathione s-transferase p 10 [Fusarium flagelliforme]|uniref:Glutathione s-transferase p 10 n=1 Tax=Fusarium flagelliforme TaxID=2675880 RepID=A0A395M6A9_9HYPO|nr:glutathione s-transferase p 10 [Fusarium flagelliforme]
MSNKDSVVYHYLAIGKLGRGEPIKLFMIDAGIEFEERLYARDDTWPATKEKLIKQGLSRNGQVPSLEYKGHVLTNHIPILRYLSRDLGRYDGQTSEDKYLTDLAQWVRNLKEGPRAEYKETIAPQYYDLIGKYYADREGPYLLGDEISYTDFTVYVSIDNDARTKTLPAKLSESLLKFKAAFEARPKLVEYINQG